MANGDHDSPRRAGGLFLDECSRWQLMMRETHGMGWTRVSTEVVHQGLFLSLFRDFVIRPDGSRGTYEHVAVDDTVRVVALDGQGHVVLVEDDFCLQARRVLHLPGGGTSGQEPCTAARRELAEETGRTASEIRALSIIDPLPGVTTARTHLYLATGLREGPPSREATEAAMQVITMPLSAAVAAVEDGRITEAGSVVGLLLAHRYQKG
ncbi:NUDIX domain-containing protein [Streptomyces sp. NPDC056549]|uniref:NUDIX domain-containing protein n=1 Tax=Streptomyces sp. NPDC056549 TaxID=3345864 RepID=UPI0036A56296